MRSYPVFIYGLIDPRSNELRYVGKSIDPDYRFSEHLSSCFEEGTYKGNWLINVLRNGFIPELVILEITTVDSWQESEMFWIEYFQWLGARLTNMTIGGECGTTSEDVKKRISKANKGRILTEEQKRKISVAGKGRIVSEELRERISAAQRGRIFTEEHRRKISEAGLGRSITEEHRQKISTWSKGRVFTEEHKRKISESNIKTKARNLARKLRREALKEYF